MTFELTHSTSKAHSCIHANCSQTIYGQRIILFYNILWANAVINDTENQLVEKEKLSKKNSNS